jgi:hypothetical protein
MYVRAANHLLSLMRSVNIVVDVVLGVRYTVVVHVLGTEEYRNTVASSTHPGTGDAFSIEMYQSYVKLWH